jgi:endogenous inhibitor of DNA gyrase (YacG/DUF329 family)
MSQPKEPQSKCPICGKSFLKKTKWHEFCSRPCRFENWIREEVKRRTAATK